MSDITNRLRELAHAVADQRWSEFSMRVPADRGRDADLVLMRAADEITQLRAENARLIAAAPDMTEADGLIQRLRAEPTASQFLRIGDLVESLVAERNEAADRIASLEAEKAERERQEPVAWVLFDDIFIAPKDMQDDPPNLECMKPLYAHPLALREPTEDECSRIYAIADRNPITRGPEIGEMPVRAGRAMWQAVREVMTK